MHRHRYINARTVGEADKQTAATVKYEITVTVQEAEAEAKQPKMITFGMFPQLQALTEEDFKSVEW